MSTTELSPHVAGALTIALIVGLGVFIYPWLLAQRYGRWIVGLMTVLLGALFVAFQEGSSGTRSSLYSLVLAAAWALGPVIAGVIVWRTQRKSGQGTPEQ